MNGCVLSKNKARIGPALASAEAEVGRETLVLSSVVFEENTPLCGSDQFVDTYHNVREVMRFPPYVFSVVCV